MSVEDERYKYKTKTTKKGQRERMKKRGWFEVPGSTTSTGKRGVKGDVYSGEKVKTKTTYRKLKKNQPEPRRSNPLL